MEVSQRCAASFFVYGRRTWCDMHASFPDCPKKSSLKHTRYSLSPALSERRGRTISEIPRCVWEDGMGKRSLSPALSEGRGRIISEIPRCTWECITRCLGVFGGWFWRRKIDKLHAINYEFTNCEKVICMLWLRIYEFIDRWIACDKLRIYEFIDRWIASSKPRIYELTNRRIACDKYLFIG